MYLSFYQLKHKPFQISTDPRFLWLGEKHEEALATLKYGVLDNKGFLLLTGDVGTGKTTLINALLNSLDKDTYVASIRDPALDPLDFFQYTAHAFGMQIKNINSKVSFLIQFEEFLLDAYENQRKVLLIIDEAQRMSQELLEEVRLLSNIEKEESKLLNIFFVGQIEFNSILLQPENRAIRQRVTVSYNIETLSEKETQQYIKHRLDVASTEKITSFTPLQRKETGEYVKQGFTLPLPDTRREIFSPEAVREIYAYAKGYPRLINILCDRALLTGYVEESRTITGKHIKECVKELEIPHFTKEEEKEEKKGQTEAPAAAQLTTAATTPQQPGGGGQDATQPDSTLARGQISIAPERSSTGNIETKFKAQAEKEKEPSAHDLLHELNRLANRKTFKDTTPPRQEAPTTGSPEEKETTLPSLRKKLIIAGLLLLLAAIYLGFQTNREGSFGFAGFSGYLQGLFQPTDRQAAPRFEPDGVFSRDGEERQAQAPGDSSGVNSGTENLETFPGELAERLAAVEEEESLAPVISPETEAVPGSLRLADNAEKAEKMMAEEREEISRKIRLLKKLITFQKLVIPFSSDSASPPPESLGELDELIESLLAHQSFKVTVTYHNSANQDADKQAGVARSQAGTIKNYLMGKGVEEPRIRIRTREKQAPLLLSEEQTESKKGNWVELYVDR